jgi:hypothetical protein
MSESLTLVFGSRDGSVAALLFFAAVFGLVGAAAARELRRRGGTARASVVVGAILILGPVLLIHVSSTGGFYEARVRDGSLRLRYLLWPVVVDVPRAEIIRADARPAFRGRWRLRLQTTDGTEYESATSTRAEVEAAAQRVLRMTPTP